MPYITIGKENSGNIDLYYKDWGSGQPVVFSHGWPLSADAWEDQMMFLASRGYRCIAHDRRGHGRSSQPWNGNDMDTYADDLAALVEALDLRNAVHVGHSTGGGEVARYIGRHGTKRVAKAVLVNGIPPLMLKTPANPGGLPIEAFDAIRAGVLADRSQFFKDLTGSFYGANRPGATVSQGVRDSFWLQGMQAGLKGAFDCIKVFSETDHTEDLKKFDVPTLIIHGDDDQIVPIGASAMLSSKIVKGSTLKVYPGAPHGFPPPIRTRSTQICSHSSRLSRSGAGKATVSCWTFSGRAVNRRRSLPKLSRRRFSMTIKQAPAITSHTVGDVITQTAETRPPFPPFTLETAIQKVRAAENGWNSCNPEKVSLAYSAQSRWRNRSELVVGRQQIVSFLQRKWARELDYRLIKELWAFQDNRIAVRFAYEWHDDAGNWFRSFGNENWEFDAHGLMTVRHASINDLPIREEDRKFHWPLGRRPKDHPGLSSFGF